MIKYFCDRCGKEAKKTIQVSVPKEKLNEGFNTMSLQVCDDCKKEFDKIINKLTDIRFILFSDFI